MSPRPSFYAGPIRMAMARLGRVGAADPRHVEAYMRLEHATLDNLSPRAFVADVEVALVCVEMDGLEAAERCALSFGL